MGQCGPVCQDDSHCQTCATVQVSDDMIAKDFGKLLLPFDLSLTVAKLTFTRVEFANGNEDSIINLCDFGIKGMSFTGTMTIFGPKTGEGFGCGAVANVKSCFSPRPGHAPATSSPATSSEYSIRILANIDNSPDGQRRRGGLKVDVVDVDLVKCPFNLSSIITEEKLCAAVAPKLTDHVNAKILQQLNMDMVQQLIVVDDSSKRMPAHSKSSKLGPASPQKQH